MVGVDVAKSVYINQRGASQAKCSVPYIILSMVLMLAFTLKELLPWAILALPYHPARRITADWR